MNLTPDVVDAFLPEAGEFQAEPLGSGLIHQTILVQSEVGDHVFQRLNDHVFPQLELVMENIEKVTTILKSHGEPTLNFLNTSEDKSMLFRAESGVWRCSEHMPNTTTYDLAPSPSHLKNAARAFASFGKRLSQEENITLHPTIVGFHDTPQRFERMEAAWKAAQPERQSVADYYALRHAATAFPEFGLAGLLAPQVPQTVSHNDTKLNNCLFQAESDQVRCVIDLDTVMEGSWLLDFGDLCRTSICPLPEDTEDLDLIEVDLDRFQALTEGYAEVLGDSISEAERSRMVYAAFLLTYELALRFFTDHLDNDRYFGARIPEHNLIRTRSQLTLALKITAARVAMEQIVSSAFARVD